MLLYDWARNRVAMRGWDFLRDRKCTAWVKVCKSREAHVPKRKPTNISEDPKKSNKSSLPAKCVMSDWHARRGHTMRPKFGPARLKAPIWPSTSPVRHNPFNFFILYLSILSIHSRALIVYIRAPPLAPPESGDSRPCRTTSGIPRCSAHRSSSPLVLHIRAPDPLEIYSASLLQIALG